MESINGRTNAPNEGMTGRDGVGIGSGTGSGAGAGSNVGLSEETEDPEKRREDIELVKRFLGNQVRTCNMADAVRSTLTRKGYLSNPPPGLSHLHSAPVLRPYSTSDRKGYLCHLPPSLSHLQLANLFSYPFFSFPFFLIGPDSGEYQEGSFSKRSD